MTATVGDKYFTPLATLMGVSVSPQFQQTAFVLAPSFQGKLYLFSF
jgi:hypothetical protein